MNPPGEGSAAVAGAPALADVRAAAVRIAPHVHRTPVLRSSSLDRELGAQVAFKCENLQKVGAFKARGAANAVLMLVEEEAARGVVTHSSGNHGAALAWAASLRQVPCTVVVPQDAPALKVDAVRRYGAEVVPCARAERAAVCARLVTERGLRLVHPYEDAAVIAGQGTATLELLEEVPDLDVLVAPIGGGGLMSGAAIVVRGLGFDVALYGAEPEAVDDAARSLRSGALQGVAQEARTWADGLMAPLGRVNFELLRWGGVQVVTVSEAALLDAARVFVHRLKIVVEPSSATALAAVRALGEHGALRDKRVGVLVSGGNTDLAWL